MKRTYLLPIILFKIRCLLTNYLKHHVKENSIFSVFLENKLFALALASNERDEGITAFKEKRPANFRK